MAHQGHGADMFSLALHMAHGLLAHLEVHVHQLVAECWELVAEAHLTDHSVISIRLLSFKLFMRYIQNILQDEKNLVTFIYIFIWKYDFYYIESKMFITL